MNEKSRKERDGRPAAPRRDSRQVRSRRHRAPSASRLQCKTLRSPFRLSLYISCACTRTMTTTAPLRQQIHSHSWPHRLILLLLLLLRRQRRRLCCLRRPHQPQWCCCYCCARRPLQIHHHPPFHRGPEPSRHSLLGQGAQIVDPQGHSARPSHRSAGPWRPACCASKRRGGRGQARDLRRTTRQTHGVSAACTHPRKAVATCDGYPAQSTTHTHSRTRTYDPFEPSGTLPFWPLEWVVLDVVVWIPADSARTMWVVRIRMRLSARNSGRSRAYARARIGKGGNGGAHEGFLGGVCAAVSGALLHDVGKVCE